MLPVYRDRVGRISLRRAPSEENWDRLLDIISAASVRGRETRKVGAGLRVIRLQFERVLEIFACSVCLPCTGFEDAEVIPAVCVGISKFKGLPLFRNGFFQMPRRTKHLR